MRIYNNKKTELAFTKIVEFTIALIVIVVVIIFVIKYINNRNVSTPTCQKDYNGVCYNDKSACNPTYTVVKGYGCPKDSPYCCIPPNIK